MTGEELREFKAEFARQNAKYDKVRRGRELDESFRLAMLRMPFVIMFILLLIAFL